MVAADSKVKLLQDAERHVLHGKVQQAIGEYLKIVKIDPNDVLILNTIGDLYLRQGKNSEANKYFSQVAQNYVQNNFFLKAIAVYKKILNADPDNLEINTTMASLYAQQGLSIDARNQYQRVAALLEKEGRAKESVEAYESIVELDPANAAIHCKLAGLYASEGANEKAHSHWSGAARAQAKAGNYAGAAESYSRAMQIKPLDIDAMRGFLDCSIQLKDPVPALNQLKKCIDSAPDNLDMREMLGQAHLANNDPESAAKVFHVVVSMDENRYGNLFPTAAAFIARGLYDQALSCLDPVIPALISRRETEKAVKLFDQILQLDPTHVLSMVKLASIYSATGDQARYMDILDRISDRYIELKSPIEAIEYLEKILQVNPESEKHLRLHSQAFAEAYPNTPYISPVEPPEPVIEIDSVPVSQIDIKETGSEPAAASSEMVEIDLLINYGLKEKALSILLSIEARDPYDKEARMRLLSLYKSEKKHTEAAEQCLLIAALHRRSNNEDAAQSYLAEAQQLAPEMAGYVNDLDAFARKNGIQPAENSEAPPVIQMAEPEVDLSSDLLDIFFSNDQEDKQEEPAIAEMGSPEPVADPFPQAAPPVTSSKPVEEQLQEVDFYIRLGFQDEALSKLDEIARVYPDHPEVTSRYQKLKETAQPEAHKPIVFEISDESAFGEPAPEVSVGDIFSELDLDGTFDRFVENASDAIPPEEAGSVSMPPAPAPAVVPEPPAKSEFQANDMFADLIDEVANLPDAEVLNESFEDHFSLGMAYRDMELTDEAVREFELAMKIARLKRESGQMIQCCGMLSTCFLKKNMPSSALRWCQTGLNISGISSHEAMALRYDMGIAHAMAGSKDRALECFDDIFGTDPGYRDIAQRIDELRAKGGFERHAP